MRFQFPDKQILDVDLSERINDDKSTSKWTSIFRWKSAIPISMPIEHFKVWLDNPNLTQYEFTYPLFIDLWNWSTKHEPSWTTKLVACVSSQNWSDEDKIKLFCHYEDNIKLICLKYWDQWAMDTVSIDIEDEIYACVHDRYMDIIRVTNNIHISTLLCKKYNITEFYNLSQANLSFIVQHMFECNWKNIVSCITNKTPHNANQTIRSILSSNISVCFDNVPLNKYTPPLLNLLRMLLKKKHQINSLKWIDRAYKDGVVSILKFGVQIIDVQKVPLNTLLDWTTYLVDENIDIHTRVLDRALSTFEKTKQSFLRNKNDQLWFIKHANSISTVFKIWGFIYSQNEPSLLSSALKIIIFKNWSHFARKPMPTHFNPEWFEGLITKAKIWQMATYACLYHHTRLKKWAFTWISNHNANLDIWVQDVNFDIIVASTDDETVLNNVLYNVINVPEYRMCLSSRESAEKYIKCINMNNIQYCFLHFPEHTHDILKQVCLKKLWLYKNSLCSSKYVENANKKLRLQ